MENAMYPDNSRPNAWSWSQFFSEAAAAGITLLAILVLALIMGLLTCLIIMTMQDWMGQTIALPIGLILPLLAL
jgi:hypothetical protein